MGKAGMAAGQRAKQREMGEMMCSEEAKHQVLEGFKNCELGILVVDERRKIMKGPDQRSDPVHWKGPSGFLVKNGLKRGTRGNKID